MYLQELFYFLAGITRKLRDLTHLEYFPIKLVEKCVLICYDKSVITDPAISVKEIDGKPYYFNERYPGYKRDLVEFAIGMCILEIEYQSRETVRLHPIVNRIIRSHHAFLTPTLHAEMHSREIEELVKSFSKCGGRVTNFLQVSRFLAPFLIIENLGLIHKLLIIKQKVKLIKIERSNLWKIYFLFSYHQLFRQRFPDNHHITMLFMGLSYH